jgi:hypothetical protein
MTLQCQQPSSQRKRIPDPFLSLHVHPDPAPAFPLPHYAKPLTPGPSAAGPTMYVRDRHIPQSMLCHRPWHPTAPPPTLQMFGPEVQVLNTQARGGPAAVHEHM